MFASRIQGQRAKRGYANLNIYNLVILLRLHISIDIVNLIKNSNDQVSLAQQELNSLACVFFFSLYLFTMSRKFQIDLVLLHNSNKHLFVPSNILHVHKISLFYNKLLVSSESAQHQISVRNICRVSEQSGFWTCQDIWGAENDGWHSSSERFKANANAWKKHMSWLNLSNSSLHLTNQAGKQNLKPCITFPESVNRNQD